MDFSINRKTNSHNLHKQNLSRHTKAQFKTSAAYSLEVKQAKQNTRKS